MGEKLKAEYPMDNHPLGTGGRFACKLTRAYYNANLK